MSPQRTHRSADERIAALQAEIERIKSRAAEQKVKKDPALRHISGALRSLDKALNASKDKAMRTALTEARATLSACLALEGVETGKRSSVLAPRARREAPEPDAVLDYVKKHPGARSEDICSALDTDALTLRPVLHSLRDDGRIKVEGKARATRYTVVGR